MGANGRVSGLGCSVRLKTGKGKLNFGDYD